MPWLGWLKVATASPVPRSLASTGIAVAVLKGTAAVSATPTGVTAMVTVPVEVWPAASVTV